MMDEAQTDYVLTTRPVIPPFAEQPWTVTSNPHVILRPFDVNDLHALHELRTDIEVMKWTSTGLIDADLAATRTWMNRFMQADLDPDLPPTNDNQTQITSLGASSFNFVIVYCDSIPEPNNETPTTIPTGSVIGAGGCHSLGPYPECGYMILRSHWGRGIATASLQAWLNLYWALDRKLVNFPRVGATVDSVQVLPDDSDNAVEHSPGYERETLKAEVVMTNVGSVRVLEKCGFKFVSSETIPEHGTVVELGLYVLARP